MLAGIWQLLDECSVDTYAVYLSTKDLALFA